ncbi:MAG: hypothetical protein ACAH65_00220 [Chloroflexota bacterium]
MGANTDAARAEVLAARDGLATEVERLEAAGRAAVDIPARVRREPAKMAGAAAGAAFLLLGGPGRVVRGIRRSIFGPDAELPKSMLPDEVQKTLKKLGSDGERVRGTLEREFADYLEEKAPERRDRDLGAAATGMLVSILKPVSVRFGKQLAERLLDPDAPSFADGLRKAQVRQARMPVDRATRASGPDVSDGGASSG